MTTSKRYERRGQTDITLAELIERKLISHGEVIRLGFSDHYAEITEKGMIEWRGVVYKSPTAAAVAITQSSVNGWTRWRINRDDEWVPLDRARKEARGK